jgi:hypothetical protein
MVDDRTFDTIILRTDRAQAVANELLEGPDARVSCAVNGIVVDDMSIMGDRR